METKGRAFRWSKMTKMVKRKEKKKKRKKGRYANSERQGEKEKEEKWKELPTSCSLFSFFFFSSCLGGDPRASTRREKVYLNELFHRDKTGNKDVPAVKEGSNAYNYRGQKVRGDSETRKWSGLLLSRVVAHPLVLEDSGSLVARGNEKLPGEHAFYPLCPSLSFFLVSFFLRSWFRDSQL